MTNQQIAQILSRTAQLLELKGANPFEVRAYRRAAREVESAQGSIERNYRRGGVGDLTKLSGIGPTIANQIKELIETGRLAKYTKLKQSIPKVELELIEIPSLGPKTAQKIVSVLKLKSRADLVRRLKKRDPRIIQKLAQLSLKEKTLQNIIRGADQIGRQTARLTIAEALPIAQTLLTGLKNHPGVIQADVVGSLRRWQETVGDIDLVASVKKGSAVRVIDYFVKLNGIKRVLAQGKTKAVVIHSFKSTRIDLEILAQKEYGSLLQHLTGSKEHNIALRSWAVQHGFSISEHGLKILKTGKTKHNKLARVKTSQDGLVTCPTEAKLYRTLGMDWIPPELRENRGEIEAALTHKLPKLIELKDIKGDLHAHTRLSFSRLGPEEMARAAIGLGYSYLAITDHSQGLGVTGGLDRRQIIVRRKIFDRLNERYKRHKFRLLLGVELNIRADGQLDLDDQTLKLCDWVLAAIHSSFNQSGRVLTERYLKAINNRYVHALAHPSGRRLNKQPGMDIFWQDLFTACRQASVALEINSAPYRLDLPDRLIRQASQLGNKFVINTDSHSPDQLGLMGLGVAQAARGWLTSEQVLNTLDYTKLASELVR